MKLNIDCIRDIMIYLESALIITYTEDDYEITKNSIRAIDVIEALPMYSPEDIWYSIDILASADCIDAGGNEENVKQLQITQITYKGHQFLESIKPQPVWEKTKSIISKIGIHTLSFVEDTAQSVIKEFTKQLVGM